MELNAILNLIDMGSLTLPRFQRGYVWKRPDVSKLMRSLYKGYPVGSLLIWETHATQKDIRGGQELASGGHKLLLDGQQRITSLYGIINDKVPLFSDGHPSAFRNLYFNVESEDFEFYGPVKMKDDKLWISVTALMQKGIGPFFPRFVDHPCQELYVNRLLAITNIKQRNFHVDTVTDSLAAVGEEPMDVVVDIFNQVNSGGTKLSKGDLALAKICAYWPDAREEMQHRLNKWSDNGYNNFNLDWVLRCINAILTGQSDFAELDKHDFDEADIHSGLQRVEKHVDTALNLIASRLGLDDSYVLGSPNSLPAVLRFLEKEKTFPDFRTRDRLLYWYVHAMLWARYSGPVETVIRQDLQAVDENDDPVGALIKRLRQNRGNLRVEPQDFAGATRGSRFYPLLYMLTRVYGAKDFDSGMKLQRHMLGKNTQLELHHIFPKAKLSKYGYHWRNDNNSLANFTLLTQETNRMISAKLPEEYFPRYKEKHPGVLKSHWIPEDPELWKIENYRDFLAARRELLAKAANDFLDQLYHGELDTPIASGIEAQSQFRPISIASDEEESVLQAAMQWMEAQGLPRGEYGYELVDDTGNLLATLDLAWPRGIQEGMTRQAALLIDESEETRNIAEDQDYKCFTNLPDLQQHVQREILGE